MQHASGEICPQFREYTVGAVFSPIHSFGWFVRDTQELFVAFLKKICAFYPVGRGWLWIVWTSHCSSMQHSECFLYHISFVHQSQQPLCHWVKWLLKAVVLSKHISHTSHGLQVQVELVHGSKGIEDHSCKTAVNSLCCTTAILHWDTVSPQWDEELNRLSNTHSIITLKQLNKHKIHQIKRQSYNEDSKRSHFTVLK